MLKYRKQKKHPAFNIYPLPAEEVINYTYETGSASEVLYKIYDIRGKSHKQGRLESKAGTIDTVDLKSGSYILELADERYTIIDSHKFIKHYV